MRCRHVSFTSSIDPLASPSERAQGPSAATRDAREKLLDISRAIRDPHRNAPPAQERCIATLHSIVSNALTRPDDTKYRKIRCANKTVAAAVANCLSGEEFLLASGFARKVDTLEAYYVCGVREEGGGRWSVSPTTLPALRERLDIARDVLQKALASAREKTERYEREKNREKNEMIDAKEKAKAAIAEDKERRRQAEARKRDAKALAAAAETDAA